MIDFENTNDTGEKEQEKATELLREIYNDKYTEMRKSLSEKVEELLKESP
jgi:hypothetical protein